MKPYKKIIVIMPLIPICLFLPIIIVSIIMDYKPKPITVVYKNDNAPVLNKSEFDFIIWNIGYAGLSADMDFFYDGGKQVRTSQNNVKNNLAAISSFILNANTDFTLLQEVDIRSKRSWYINEYEILVNLNPQWYSAFGKNYSVFFVPVPLLKPLGPVKAGLQTLSRFEPFQVERHTFPGNFYFPKSVFMLDRCFLVSRYHLPGNKEFLVINTHNSAYDNGSLRRQQMDFLKDFLVDEFNRGHYIAVGGDWNQVPADFIPVFNNYLRDTNIKPEIDSSFLPDWKFVYDNRVPTNRQLSTPYNPETSLSSVIDYYLLSPNIRALKVETISMEFAHSDHQPVFLSLRLNIPSAP